MQTIKREHQKRQRADYTAIVGNPANALHASYQELMAIADPAQLADQALAIVKPYAGNGMSPAHFAKFEEAVAKNRRSPNALQRLQQFISNFVLAAAGHGVVKCA